MQYHIPAILSVALLGACGTDAPADRSVPASRDGLVVIEMTDDMTFSPNTITAAVGDTIVWVNRGDLPHTTTARADFLPLEQIPSAAASWDSGLMNAGTEFRIVVQAKGEYRYVCTLHQAAGMVAHFRVE
jgi:plastocyanin